MTDITDPAARRTRLIAAARRLHDAIGCHYGDFTEIDSEHGDNVHEAARHFVDEYEAPMNTAPCDWDHQARCWEDDCTNPATHRRLSGMADDTPVYELVCCGHASQVAIGESTQ